MGIYCLLVGFIIAPLESPPKHHHVEIDVKPVDVRHQEGRRGAALTQESQGAATLDGWRQAPGEPPLGSTPPCTPLLR
jgi:hypothetical protein